MIDFEKERIQLIPPEERNEHESQYLKSKNIISLGSVVANNDKNLVYKYKLKHNDEVFVQRGLNTVELIGAFNYPGRYSYKENMTIKEYIKLAGGKSKYSNNKVYLIDVYNNKKRIKNMNYVLHSGDKVFIESKSNQQAWNSFKEILTVITQAATFIAVIDSVSE